MKKNLRFTKKTTLITAAAIMVIAGVGTGFALYSRDDNVTNPEPINPINYDPPTTEEQDQAQANKERLSQESSSSQNPTSGAKQVTPVITNASQIGQQITVNAYIAGIFEDGGKCTATFTKGSTKIMRETEGMANVSTTDCTPFRLDRSEFPQGGDWQVVVSYKSTTADRGSQSKTLTLQ